MIHSMCLLPSTSEGLETVELHIDEKTIINVIDDSGAAEISCQSTCFIL